MGTKEASSGSGGSRFTRFKVRRLVVAVGGVDSSTPKCPANFPNFFHDYSQMPERQGQEDSFQFTMQAFNQIMNSTNEVGKNKMGQGVEDEAD